MLKASRLWVQLPFRSFNFFNLPNPRASSTSKFLAQQLLEREAEAKGMSLLSVEKIKEER
jgi:hypothetical protein